MWWGQQWAATGVQGVYVDDRRAVSVLAVHLGDESPVPVADASSGSRSDFLSCARQLGNPGADPTVEVRRRRTVTFGCRNGPGLASAEVQL